MRLFAFLVPIAKDKTTSHVPAAIEKRDCAALTSPAHRRCTATEKTSKHTDKRLAHDTGAGQMNVTVMRAVALRGG